MSSAPNSSTLPPKSDGNVRHCGFCLNICPFPVKKCGKCKKRAYCSKECQTADWPVNGNGQRHKNWCGIHEYGEEDIDWEVVPVPNKGLGIRAKRLLPAGYRIIVEPVFTDPYGHPGIVDLEPKGASLGAKFKLNCTEGSGTNLPGEKDFLALRLSRVNHNCRPNAGCSYDDVAQVSILYALQDIQPGEELCNTYVSFARVDLNRLNAGRVPPEFEFNICEMSLKTHWGIACPSDCFCKDADARKMVLEGRRLSGEIMSRLQSGWAEGALTAGEKRLDIQRRLNMSWSDLARFECELYHISLMQKKTLPKAARFVKDVLRIYKTISPYSKLIEKYEKLLKHPESDEYYLNMEKK